MVGEGLRGYYQYQTKWKPRLQILAGLIVICLLGYLVYAIATGGASGLSITLFNLNIARSVLPIAIILIVASVLLAILYWNAKRDAHKAACMINPLNKWGKQGCESRLKRGSPDVTTTARPVKIISRPSQGKP